MIDSITNLAIMGGKAAFDTPLHVGRPNIGDREAFLKRTEDILDSLWFTNDGQQVQEFERKICDFLGVRNCVVMTNATIALEIAIRAIGMTGEVIVPSFTFVATPHALQWQEITPVFCDVGSDSHHIDPERIESMITPLTSGIIGVHIWGDIKDVEQIQDIANRHNLHLLFDAAHAIGSAYKGKMIGNFGDAEVFSFHATKFVNAFEGGAITTNNDKLADRMRFMRNFGFADYDQVDYVGTNGKMTEISAAMGITSLENIDHIVEINKRNYHTYAKHLQDIPGVKLYCYNESDRRNFQYIILEIDADMTGISRDEIVRVLHTENVLARRYFYPGCHQMEPYRSYYPHAGLLLPNTEALTMRVMSLPTGTSIDEAQIETICNLIKIIVESSALVREGLKDS